MVKYYELKVSQLNDRELDKIYIDLLKNKPTFVIIKTLNEKYVLTKEKSLIKIDNLEEFLKQAQNDIYYKTEIQSNREYTEEDLEMFKKYIEQYRMRMLRKYGEKYLFGSVAIRTTNNAFITTLRGKENLEGFTIVNSVDDKQHIVNTCNKKATLNAPLLNQLFKNKKVKAIVHINHEYDKSLPYYEYAFPGTVRDSFRDNSKSFNIEHHGLFLLIDDKENII